MKKLEVITDPVFTPPNNYNFFDKFFLNLINDERDLPFVYLTLKITFTMVPIGIALYFVENTWVWALLAILYFFLNNFTYKGPFGLMLHCTSHRKWFKRKYELMNHYLPWVIGPFFGQTPETYYVHHIHMHHAENNLDDDISSTMFYQRDNFRDWLAYLVNFIFQGLKQLIGYFKMRNRTKLATRALRGEVSFILLCFGLSFISFSATLMVFILPFIISRIIMMMGNFTQHAFVDPEDPANPYKNSITCINVKYNHKCWNDGYHISHHIKPHLHWTEHPKYFKKTLDKYVENKAIVFDGIDYLPIFFYLMAKNYKKLAEHIVNIDGMFNSTEEAIEHLKARTRKFDKTSWQRRVTAMA